jgi:hypothetical protein
MRRLATAVSAVLTVCSFTPISAQSLAGSGSSLSLGAGASFFDHSGAGAAPMVAIRGDLPLGRFFALDGGFVAAWPVEQFKALNTMLIPEVGAELHLPTRVAPYVATDVGRALAFRRSLADGNDMSYSAALGTRVWITGRRGLVAEYRLRGIGERFAGSESEFTLGMVWR